MEIELKQIIEYINEDIIECFGDASPVKIKYIKEPAFVDEYSLDWVNISKSEKQSIAENSKAKVVICDPDIKYSQSIKEQDKVLIHVLNPRLVISKIGRKFFLQSPTAEIHPTSTIHPKATIGTNVYIGPNVVLGNCKIGDNCVLYGNNYIFDNVVLEHNVVINPGTVIGVPGLGCERTEDKKLVSFPHLGGVIIKEHVEIGANCQIARGAFSNTIINSGTKINGLCFIAHNCNIGKNVFITGSSMLAGSVSIGDNTTIYSKVIIREHVKVGSSSIIGMGAVVTKHVPDGETWIGSPAKKITK